MLTHCIGIYLWSHIARVVMYVIVRVGVGVGLNGECCERPNRERVPTVFDERSGEL